MTVAKDLNILKQIQLYRCLQVKSDYAQCKIKRQSYAM